jgi:hypothetical protein
MKILIAGAILGLFFTGCASVRGATSIGPATAPFDAQPPTRAQKIVYGSYYVDFYATLQGDIGGQTCFLIRVETDDRRLDSAQKWNVYLKRNNNIPLRLEFRSYVPEPQEKYPLVYNARACADDVWDHSAPLYIYVVPQVRKGIDPIRLEWSI